MDKKSSRSSSSTRDKTGRETSTSRKKREESKSSSSSTKKVKIITRKKQLKIQRIHRALYLLQKSKCPEIAYTWVRGIFTTSKTISAVFLASWLYNCEFDKIMTTYCHIHSFMSNLHLI